MEDSTRWRRCSGCKKPIAFGADYWVCNVSTCNRKSNAFVFCSVECWDGHLGIVRHRESWAVEAKAPTRAEWAAQERAGSAGASKPASAAGAESAGRSPSTTSAASSEAPRERRRILPGATRAADGGSDDLPREILIVASKLKAYVRARSGYNTSDRVLEPLSRLVREICDDAIERATRDERKTVLDRDFPKTLR